VNNNIIPRGQGRNLADAMDLCLTDLLNRGEPINLPAIMISHISRIVKTARAHNLGSGFLLVLVFGRVGVRLQKKVGVKMTDEIGSSTLVGCGFKVTKGGSSVLEQGPQTPFTLIPSFSTSEPSVNVLLQDQSRLRDELSEDKQALPEEKALNAKHHEDLMSMLVTLTSTSPP